MMIIHSYNILCLQLVAAAVPGEGRPLEAAGEAPGGSAPPAAGGVVHTYVQYIYIYIYVYLCVYIYIYIY